MNGNPEPNFMKPRSGEPRRMADDRSNANSLTVSMVAVPTWLWVTVAIWFFVKALAIAQHVVWVMGPRGGVG